MSQDTVAIQVDIAGRNFPLRVNVAEEQEMRTVANDLNNRLKTLQSQFPRQEKVDYLSMALLTYATDLHKVAENTIAPHIQKVVETVYLPAPEAAPTTPNISDELSEQLSNLEAILDKLLQ